MVTLVAVGEEDWISKGLLTFVPSLFIVSSPIPSHLLAHCARHFQSGGVEVTKAVY
jgi:hypothetical protein